MSNQQSDSDNTGSILLLKVMLKMRTGPVHYLFSRRAERLKTAGGEKEEEEKMIQIVYQLHNPFWGNSGYNIHTQILKIFTTLCSLQIPFTYIILFDFSSKPVLDMILISSILMMEKNLFKISKVEAGCGTQLWMFWLKATVLWYSSVEIRIHDSTIGKWTHQGISKVWGSACNTLSPGSACLVHLRKDTEFLSLICYSVTQRCDDANVSNARRC